MRPTIADPTGLNFLGLNVAFNADGGLTLDTDALGYGSVAHCMFSCPDLPFLDLKASPSLLCCSKTPNFNVAQVGERAEQQPRMES